MTSQSAAATGPGAMSPTPTANITIQPLPQDGIVEVEDDANSSFGEDYNSDTTSVASNIYRGIIENGRRYQVVREGEYWSPSDDKQFQSMNLAYLVYLVLDSQEDNPFFHSPIGSNPQNILDLGTGQGDWAVDVADAFPSAVVRGVDLFPPPQKFVPSNCTFEVDDIAKKWLWTAKMDLIHLRYMLGSFTAKQWKGVYEQAYDQLAPGGWIEQVECGLDFFSDDNTIPADSKLAGWGEMFYAVGRKSEKPMDIFRTMKDSIAAAGFINVHEKEYKIPIGPWAKHPLYKEAGRLALEQFMTGLEGYGLYLLTKYGAPEPWSAEEVHTHIDAIKVELRNKRIHSYTKNRRVWAQKPYDAAPVNTVA